MAKFNIYYHLNDQTVKQSVEGKDPIDVRDNHVIKNNQWITDSNGNLVYINFEKINVIKVTSVGRVSAARGW
ncbi:hypothetical protein [Bacillus massiliglaciei]|uniref:hypothetical protein n=1 Tax=Bacillus massiliglaciei TaxID=1816693 RepID=UPI000DA61510|nr:hypothetical protein [Bacillus massiliglaciei]